MRKIFVNQHIDFLFPQPQPFSRREKGAINLDINESPFYPWEKGFRDEDDLNRISMRNMIKIKDILTLIIAAILCSGAIYAQQESSEEEKSAAEPMSLPQLIIIDKADLNVKSGIKKFPDKTEPLNENELDSLNSLEKQPSLLLPIESLPTKPTKQEQTDGCLKGSFGRFTTTAAEAGYGFEISDYKFYGNAGLEISDGHEDYADYGKFNVNAVLDYIAPRKYWIFGGSRTRTYLDLYNNNFNLYAIESAPQRNVLALETGVKSDGNYQGYDFSVGGAFESMNMSQTGHSAADNGINGFLEVKNLSNKFGLGGRVEMDLRTLRGRGMNFIEAVGFGKMTIEDIIFNLKAGFQTSTNSKKVNRSGFLLSGRMDINLNRDFTVKASVKSGLNKLSFFDLMERNPYLSDSAHVDYEYDIADVKGFLYYHPNTDIGASAGIRFRKSNRRPVIVNADSGMFSTAYPDASEIQLIFEGFWNITPEDRLTGNFTANFASLGDFDNNKIPYYAPVKFSVDYRREWLENFGTQIGFSYIGNRYIDLQNSDELSGYFNLNASVDYNLSRKLKIFVNLENMANSDIYIWNGYKERSLFAKAGVLWKF